MYVYKKKKQTPEQKAEQHITAYIFLSAIYLYILKSPRDRSRCFLFLSPFSFRPFSLPLYSTFPVQRRHPFSPSFSLSLSLSRSHSLSWSYFRGQFVWCIDGQSLGSYSFPFFFFPPVLVVVVLILRVCACFIWLCLKKIRKKKVIV